MVTAVEFEERGCRLPFQALVSPRVPSAGAGAGAGEAGQGVGRPAGKWGQSLAKDGSGQPCTPGRQLPGRAGRRCGGGDPFLPVQRASCSLSVQSMVPECRAVVPLTSPELLAGPAGVQTRALILQSPRSLVRCEPPAGSLAPWTPAFVAQVSWLSWEATSWGLISRPMPASLFHCPCHVPPH